MKIALLIPVTDTSTKKEFWTWMTPSEKVIMINVRKFLSL